MKTWKTSCDGEKLPGSSKQESLCPSISFPISLGWVILRFISHSDWWQRTRWRLEELKWIRIDQAKGRKIPNASTFAAGTGCFCVVPTSLRHIPRFNKDFLLVRSHYRVSAEQMEEDRSALPIAAGSGRCSQETQELAGTERSCTVPCRALHIGIFSSTHKQQWITSHIISYLSFTSREFKWNTGAEESRLTVGGRQYLNFNLERWSPPVLNLF